jgi:gas vesicle protein
MGKMRKDEHGTSAGKVLLSLLAGAAVGAGLSLFYASKTSKATREKIGEMADDAIDTVVADYNSSSKI